MAVLLNHLEEEGIDLRRNPIEFMTYGDSSRGSILANASAETSIKGLYAAGDESPAGEGISAAAVILMRSTRRNRLEILMIIAPFNLTKTVRHDGYLIAIG